MALAIRCKKISTPVLGGTGGLGSVRIPASSFCFASPKISMLQVLQNHRPFLWTIWQVSLCQICYQAQVARNVSSYSRNSDLRLAWRWIHSKHESLRQTYKWDWGWGSNPHHTWGPSLTGGQLIQSTTRKRDTFDWLEQWPEVTWQEAWY